MVLGVPAKAAENGRHPLLPTMPVLLPSVPATSLLRQWRYLHWHVQWLAKYGHTKEYIMVFIGLVWLLGYASEAGTMQEPSRRRVEFVTVLDCRPSWASVNVFIGYFCPMWAAG